MNSRSLILYQIIAALTAALCITPLHATDITDKLTTTSTSPGVVFGGVALGTANSNPDLGGTGYRMFWYPGKAAFRVGGVSGTYTAGTAPWDEANIGQYSFAAGLNSKAGNAAIAMGSSATSGLYSVAIGEYTSAVERGLALGYGSNATGYDACLAVGRGASATNGYSTAIGPFTKTPGWHAQALGYYAEARASETVAIGANALASNSAATAMGAYTLASGVRSTSLGYYTTARGYASTVVGQFNVVDAPSATTWVPTDPLFIVGNGTGVSTHAPEVKNSNALTVYKNGSATFQGVVRVAPGGDIPMFVP